MNLGPVYGDIQPHYVYPRDLGSSKTGFASIHISFLSRASVNFSICTEIKTQTENCQNYQNRLYHQRVHQNITTFSSYKFINLIIHGYSLLTKNHNAGEFEVNLFEALIIRVGFGNSD